MDIQASVETGNFSRPLLSETQQYVATALPPAREQEQATPLRDFIQDFSKGKSNPERLLQLSPKEIRSLSVPDYIEYLHLLDAFEQVDLSDGQLEIVAERFAKDISEERNREGMEHIHNALDIGQKTSTLLWLRACLRLPTSPDFLEKFYSYIDYPDRTVRLEAVEYLEHVLVLDAQNEKDRGEGRQLRRRFHDDVISHLLHPTYREDFEVGQGLVDVAWASFPEELPGILVNLVDQAASAKEIPKVFPYAYAHVVNRVGLEEGRKHLREYAKIHPEFGDKLMVAEQRLGFAKGHEYIDLRPFYTDLDFAHYSPNEQLLQFETDMLLDIFKNAGRIVDMGHGPAARNMQALRARGKKVFGFDLVAENAQMAKKMDSSIPTTVANWHHMPFAQGSVDGIYCLGRSLLHNTTVDDWINALREMRRVLGSNTSGTKVAFVDTPWLRGGNYKQEQEVFHQIARDMGIVYREQGTIHDSPDQEHFVDRMAPTLRQFVAMAKIAGFDAKLMVRKKYVDASGHKDTNLYWILTPREKPLSFGEVREAMGEVHTGVAPIFVSWI